MAYDYIERQRQRRIRLHEIQDELDRNLVKQQELRQEEVRLIEERRQLRAALVETAVSHKHVGAGLDAIAQLPTGDPHRE